MEDDTNRILTKLYYNVLHAVLLFWPARLSADYACLSIPVIESTDDPRNLHTAIFLAILVLTVLITIIPSSGDGFAKSAKRQLLVCFALVVIPFLPSCGMILTVGK